MATWRVFSGASVEWNTNTPYSLGARVVCRSAFATQARRKYVWECTTPGTSHATTEPTWPDGPVGTTVNDGTVVWTCRLPSDGSWLNASPYLLYVLNHAAAAGDIVYVHKTHNESKNWGGTCNLYGSSNLLLPVYIYCVDKDAADALATGAVVTVPSFDFQLSRCAFSYGVQYRVGAGSLRFGATNTPAIWLLESNGPGGYPVLDPGGYGIGCGYSPGYPCVVKVKGADIILGNTNVGHFRGFNVNAPGFFHWKSGKIVRVNVQGGTMIEGSLNRLLFENIDLSAYADPSDAVNTYLLDVADQGSYTERVLTRCKLPPANLAKFNLFNGAEGRFFNGRIRMYHCTAENKPHAFLERDAQGFIQDETTIVRTGGASDGTTPHSWKMVSSANPIPNFFPLISPPLLIRNTFTVAKTFTIEGILDSAANLNNGDLWVELEYPADSTTGLGAVATNRVIFAPGGSYSNLTASQAAWTTTGMSNPNRFKVDLVVTPGKAGYLTVRVYLAKPSTTVYIDPLITVS